MNQRPIVFLSLALVCIAIAFILNLMPSDWGGSNDKYINRKEVRGIDLIRDGKTYTLNLEQETKVVDILNDAIPAGAGYLSTAKVEPDFTKLVIHRFNLSDIEIQPVAYVDENLDFSAPEWYKEGTLTEVSNGKLKDPYKSLQGNSML